MTGFVGLAARDWNRSSDSDWANVLARMPLFDGVGKRDLRTLAGNAEFAEFSPGETVVAIGAPPDFFYVILSGNATAPAKPAARVLTTGDYFGEIGLLDNEPRSASIVAATELHVMRLRRRVFDDILERHPRVARALLTELGGRVRRLEHQAARPAT